MEVYHALNAFLCAAVFRVYPRGAGWHLDCSGEPRRVAAAVQRADLRNARRHAECQQQPQHHSRADYHRRLIGHYCSFRSGVGSLNQRKVAKVPGAPLLRDSKEPSAAVDVVDSVKVPSIETTAPTNVNVA